MLNNDSLMKIIVYQYIAFLMLNNSDSLTVDMCDNGTCMLNCLSFIVDWFLHFCTQVNKDIFNE